MRLVPDTLGFGAALMLICYRVCADVYDPVAVIYPDAPPVQAFFIAPGGPLERYTGNRNDWYAVYRLWMTPGADYAVLLQHEADPARVRIYALDAHPFDNVRNRIELRPTRSDEWDWRRTVYDIRVRLPESAQAPGSYLLIDWQPPAAASEPPRLSLQLVSLDARETQMGRGRAWWWPFPMETVPPSPLQRQRPIELPARAMKAPWERP